MAREREQRLYRQTERKREITQNFTIISDTQKLLWYQQGFTKQEWWPNEIMFTPKKSVIVQHNNCMAFTWAVLCLYFRGNRSIIAAVCVWIFFFQRCHVHFNNLPFLSVVVISYSNSSSPWNHLLHILSTVVLHCTLLICNIWILNYFFFLRLSTLLFQIVGLFSCAYYR